MSCEITKLKADIEHEIKSLVAKWNMSPEDINNGYCEEFADQIESRVPGATGVDSGIDSDYGGHVFIQYGDLYYDAQNPNGVSDYRCLSFFTDRVESEQFSPRMRF